MTIKRRVKNVETGQDEIVEKVVTNPIIAVLTSNTGFRIVILVLVLSMHPLGRQLLGTFGFKFPDERSLTVATEQATAAKTELGQLTDSVRELKSDVASIKANNLILNSKVDRLDQAFTGFQIDFNKWKPKDSQ